MYNVEYSKSVILGQYFPHKAVLESNCKNFFTYYAKVLWRLFEAIKKKEHVSEMIVSYSLYLIVRKWNQNTCFDFSRDSNSGNHASGTLILMETSVWHFKPEHINTIGLDVQETRAESTIGKLKIIYNECGYYVIKVSMNFMRKERRVVIVSTIVIMFRWRKNKVCRK